MIIMPVSTPVKWKTRESFLTMVYIQSKLRLRSFGRIRIRIYDSDHGIPKEWIFGL